jgi:hypothetical protein
MPVENIVSGVDLPYKLDRRIEMTLEEWIDVKDNSVQRDTEVHARNAVHLFKFEDVHRNVSMAELPSGRWVKLDGHTRCKLWKEKRVDGMPNPLILNVDVYKCKNIPTTEALYLRFDAGKGPPKGGPDLIFGAGRRVALKFESSLLARGRYGNAIKNLYKWVYGYKGSKGEPELAFLAVDKFQKELRLLDKVGPKGPDFPTAFIMTAILTFMAHGANAHEFWDRYSKGLKSGRISGFDGVEQLRAWLFHMKLSKTGSSSHYWENIGRALSAYNSYRDGSINMDKKGHPDEMSKQAVSGFIRAAKEAKEKRP